ncbi:MAG: tartrate dehydrogenase [Dehalococcoidia bacterium]|nr:tartrate dehydrogenase [Dehalococcoidia bacterium]|tara:strand:- start:16167 stop:17228 length:1062 start_codon:yes stop_codon:yes gene_type:complete
MKTYKIAVIPGDGIGVEVVNSSIEVLKALENNKNYNLDFQEFEWSSEYYFKNGIMMPEDGIQQLESFDAIFLGAVGHPEIQDHITLNGLLLPIRRAFDQFACVRPSILYPGVNTPLKDLKPYDIDLVVVRENTEGEYANVGGFQYQNFPDEVAVQSAVFTRKGCERVIRYAFDLAIERNKKMHVTSITKSNAQGYSMVLWDRTFEEVKKDYPQVSTDSLLIDAACMDFIRKPENFDVVVASNLFGDILTDIGAIITGSMGLASSGNIDPTRTSPSMFEPTHGSAPDIAGKGIANPMAQILTAGIMMKHLGENESAEIIENSVKKVLELGESISPDLGGNSSTSEVTKSIISNL